MKREKVRIPPIYLRSRVQVDYLLRLLPNLPLDPERPVEVLIQEHKAKRKPSLNALMWAGPLRDIAEQAWICGRQYSAEVWHEHFKEAYLPDPDAPGFDPEHVVEGYRTWDIDPWKGNRVLVGSTTQLTDKGMRVYLEQVEAEAATEYGVQFTTREEWMGGMVA